MSYANLAHDMRFHHYFGGGTWLPNPPVSARVLPSPTQQPLGSPNVLCQFRACSKYGIDLFVFGWFEGDFNLRLVHNTMLFAFWPFLTLCNSLTLHWVPGGSDGRPYSSFRYQGQLHSWQRCWFPEVQHQRRFTSFGGLCLFHNLCLWGPQGTSPIRVIKFLYLADLYHARENRGRL